MKHKELFILLLFFFLLIPIGLLTEYSAWGEWDISYYKKTLGFIPKGIIESFKIPAILPDYSLDNLNPVLSYYLSAILGVSIIFLAFWSLKNIKR